MSHHCQRPHDIHRIWKSTPVAMVTKPRNRKNGTLKAILFYHSYFIKSWQNSKFLLFFKILSNGIKLIRYKLDLNLPPSPFCFHNVPEWHDVDGHENSVYICTSLLPY